MRKYSIGDIVRFIYSTDIKELFKVIKVYYDTDVYEIVSLKNNRKVVAFGDELALAKDNNYSIGVDYAKMFTFDQKDIEAFDNLIKGLFFNNDSIKEGKQMSDFKEKSNTNEEVVKEAEKRTIMKMERSKAIDLLLDTMNSYQFLLDKFGDEEYKEKIDYVKELLAELTQEKTKS
ncbi:hypothetical protein [Bacillus smithii]|uniref:hypothetical protein n=1 Tax=Bacillus smithii TaxID=1479 RepID=UPI002E1AC36F|nr:hypothetical protein [Bacillus smithii]MED4929152.1 hypothetical protein [Bacillus smithii]